MSAWARYRSNVIVHSTVAPLPAASNWSRRGPSAGVASPAVLTSMCITGIRRCESGKYTVGSGPSWNIRYLPLATTPMTSTEVPSGSRM